MDCIIFLGARNLLLLRLKLFLMLLQSCGNVSVVPLIAL